MMRAILYKNRWLGSLYRLISGEQQIVAFEIRRAIKQREPATRLVGNDIGIKSACAEGGARRTCGNAKRTIPI
jgi:hypothetical protein